MNGNVIMQGCIIDSERIIKEKKYFFFENLLWQNFKLFDSFKLSIYSKIVILINIKNSEIPKLSIIFYIVSSPHKVFKSCKSSKRCSKNYGR
jgi:hypothetical protein